jgi:hypothetical protein
MTRGVKERFKDSAPGQSAERIPCALIPVRKANLAAISVNARGGFAQRTEEAIEED